MASPYTKKKYYKGLVRPLALQQEQVTPPVPSALVPDPEIIPEEELDVEEELGAPAAETPTVDLVEEGAREANGEDLSGVFDVSKEDVLGDTEEGMEDLTDVSDEDVLGEGGEEGLEDVVDVSQDDIMGYDYAPESKPEPRVRLVPGTPIRRTLPPTVGGLR